MEILCGYYDNWYWWVIYKYTIYIQLPIVKMLELHFSVVMHNWGEWIHPGSLSTCTYCVIQLYLYGFTCNAVISLSITQGSLSYYFVRLTD